MSAQLQLINVMLDLGLNVWKPDRVICRILFRLGLISHKDNIDQAINGWKGIRTPDK